MGATINYGYLVGEHDGTNVEGNFVVHELICYITQINGIDLTKDSDTELSDELVVTTIGVYNTIRSLTVEHKVSFSLGELKKKFNLTFGQIKRKEKLLKIATIAEDSLAEKEGVKVGTIIIGNQKKLMSLKGDVNSAIRSKSASFYIYDYNTDEFKFVDFEQFREGKDLNVGIEVEQMNIQLVREIMYEQYKEEPPQEVETEDSDCASSEHSEVFRDEQPTIKYSLQGCTAADCSKATDLSYNYVPRHRQGKDRLETYSKGIYLD